MIHANQEQKPSFLGLLVLCLLETVYPDRGRSHIEQLSGINFEVKAKCMGLFAFHGLFGLVPC